LTSVGGRRRRYAIVAGLLALAFGAAGTAAIVRGSSPSLRTSPQSTSGVATAAPVMNFKRLAHKPPSAARVLMSGEREALPRRWQLRQRRLDQLRAAGLPTAKARRAHRFRAEPTGAPSPVPASSFNAVDDNNLFIPPDTEGAPGPDKLLVTVNGTVRVQQKSDGAVLSTMGLSTFFNTGAIVFDPHVLYDPYANHWIVVAVANAESPVANVLLAVSLTSDPAGDWNQYSVDVDAANANWADYPMIGFNKSWIVVSVNLYTVAGDAFAGTQTYAFDKQKAYDGAASGGGAYQLFARPYPANDDFSLAPAATYDPGAPDLYLTEDYDGTGTFSNRPLRLFKLSGPVGSATLSRLGDPSGAALSALGRWSDVVPSGVGFAPQLGSPKKIDNGDARLSQCVYRNAAIWCANTVFLPSTIPTHAAVQWYKIDPAPATPDVVQAGRINDSTGARFFAYPSIAVNKYNDALLGFSRFADNQYASADYAYRGCGDAMNAFRDEAPYQAGAGSYFKTYGGTRNRWGDYSGTWVDPSDDASMWTIQEYAKAPVPTGTWGTWWAKLDAQSHAAPPTPAPVSSDHTPGVASTSTVVHVSWTPADDCAVSYAYKWSTSASDPPNPATDGTLPGNAAALASPPLVAGSSWWLHIEALDGGGTPSAVADLGPFPIVSLPPQPPPTPPPPPPPAPPVCVVPAVRGQLLATARANLAAEHCAAGAITRRYSRIVRLGRVISQGAAAGTQLASGARVSLVVSKGRAPFRPPVRVTLCYRHHTVHVTRAVDKKLRRHGATLGSCRRRR
jgi:hypothetical protein